MTNDLESLNLLTVGQVARLLHIHPNTVRRWSRKGILEYYRISSRGDRRFRKEDVNLYLFKSWLFYYDKLGIDHRNNMPVHV